MIELFDAAQSILLLPSKGALIGVTIGAIQFIYVMGKVFTFGYHFYIDHGFILVESSNHRRRVEKTLEKQGKEDSLFAIGYPHALLFSSVFILIYFGIGHFWYWSLPTALVTALIILPAIVIRVSAKEKRNKMVFQQKLDGTYDEPV